MIHGSLHETTNKVVCASIEDPEKPRPPPGFVRVKKPLVCNLGDNCIQIFHMDIWSEIKFYGGVRAEP